MAIAVKCAMCGHGYQAADHMAGRRVRCKHCGNTFQLPAEAVDASTPFKRPDEFAVAAPAGQPLKPDPLAPPSRANAAAAAAVAAAKKSPAAAAAAAHPHHGGVPVARVAPATAPAGGDDDDDDDAVPVAAAVRVPDDDDDDDDEASASLQEAPDDVFNAAFNDFASVRANTPFVFPGSVFLDRWLPLILVVISVLWLGYQVLIAGVAGGKWEPGWVGVVRLLLLLMTYASVVFPICLYGVRAAARKMQFALPSAAPWRAFATFLLPVTLGCVIWLSSGGLDGLIFGTVLGLIVALPVMWLLFRIRPDDAPVSLGYGAAAFGSGVLAAAVLLTLLNLIMVGVVKGTDAKHPLTISPFGPGFKWDGATIKPEKPPAGPPKTAPGDGAEPGESLATNDPPPGPPPGETGPDSPPGDVAPTDPAPDGSPAAPPQPPPGDVANAGDAEQAPKAEQDFETDMVEEGGAGAPPAGAPAHGRIVAEAHRRFAGPIRHVAFPAIPGSAVAIVKEGEQPSEDALELWDAANWRATAGARFVRATGRPDEYALSSDGSYVARVTTWPQLTAQVYSFANDRLLRPVIKLDRDGLDAHVLGFRTAAEVVVQYEKAHASRVEVWDVNKAKRLRRLEVAGFRPAPGNHALSRNGKLLAMVVRDAHQPGRVDVFDLETGALARQFMVEPLATGDLEVRTRGLTFSEAGDRLAGLFEHRGQALFLCWGAGDLPLHEHTLRPGFVPAGIDPDKFGGEALGLLDGAQAWVVYGARVYDTADGKPLGDLGIANVEAQRVTGPDSLVLVQRLADASRALLDVRLDLARARGGADGLD